ncbi:hypothetical protein V1514DRAFT_286280 [Lipomyces japonicus]|uniref:uncharacterized protein n=1 Tax=Lipomyces japonicus TaxID=56871 RepID=UPI0034D00650
MSDLELTGTGQPHSSTGSPNTANQNLQDSESEGGFVAERDGSPDRKIQGSSTRPNLSSIFSPDYALLDRDFLPSVNHDSPGLVMPSRNNAAGLSESQQSKLINYLDQELLHVSRKFVQKTSSDQDNSIDGLLVDLNKIVDLLWYSVSSTSTPFIQAQYLLKIADDLNDYITSLPIENANILFKFIRKLDKIFLNLIKGDIPSRSRIGNTEKVRLEGIIERTRVDIVSTLGPSSDYDYELARVYELLLQELN